VIFCVGVVLLELFVVFETGMERVVNLRDLKETGCCEVLGGVDADVREMILWLTRRSPEERPSGTISFSPIFHLILLIMIFNPFV
jgi:hypothetical protein